MAAECRYHPGADAVASCSACMAPVCGACMLFHAYRTLCPTCLPRERSRLQSRRLFFGLGVSAGVVVLGIGVLFAARFYRPPFDYGDLTPRVLAARQRLASAPCDRAAGVELGDLMVEAGDARGALELVSDHAKRCGEDDRFLWIAYSAHKELGRWNDAIDDASRLIESDPGDKDFRWWRGICYEQTGKLEAAAADYEKAIELQPRLTNIPINLADVYERLHRPCDAARTLHRFVDAHPESESTILPRATALDGKCGNGVQQL